MCLSICLSICLNVHHSICFVIILSYCLSIQFVYQSVYLSSCLYDCIIMCLSVFCLDPCVFFNIHWTPLKGIHKLIYCDKINQDRQLQKQPFILTVRFNLFAYYYQSVIVISLSLPQSDHIIRLPLYFISMSQKLQNSTDRQKDRKAKRQKDRVMESYRQEDR